MKHFSCGDVVPGCGATFTATSEQGIFEQVAVHAREHHGLTEVDDATADAVRARITDV